MHEHNACEHELKYCKVCDVAYCEKCRREWAAKSTYTITYPNTYITDGTLIHPIVNHNHEIARQEI